MASDSQKPRGLALVPFLFGQQIKMSAGDVVHSQGPGISTLTGIHHLEIASALFANVHPIQIISLPVEIAQILLFIGTAKGTHQPGQLPKMTAE
jgi:hypothetical protein